MLTPDQNKDTLQFLWAASKLVRKISTKSNTQGSNNLDTISTALRARKHRFLDGRKDKQYFCPRCSNPWNEGKFSMRIRSIQVPKLLKKKINSSVDIIKSPYKRRLLESLKLKQDIVMVFRCHICQYIAKCFITKKKVETLPTTVVKPESEQKYDIKRKKKKRRRDHVAGLKLENIIKKTKDSDKSEEAISKDVQGKEKSSETNLFSKKKLKSLPQRTENFKIHNYDKGDQQDLRHSLNEFTFKLDKVIHKNRHEISNPEKSEEQLLFQEEYHETSNSEEICVDDVNVRTSIVHKEEHKFDESTDVLNNSLNENNPKKHPKTLKILGKRAKLKKKKGQLKSKKISSKSNSHLKEFIKSL